MGKIEVKMDGDKTTKNTERYMTNVEYGDNPHVDSIYIKKAAFAEGGKRPEEIRVTIEWD